MKAVQVTLEEDLLRELAADERVRRIGRSALLRELARDYLRRERERRIDEQYARAYAGGQRDDSRWQDWPDQGDWPPEPPASGE
ncbi:MAG: ribbon-helix-helix protein, CopG family [Acidobacteriota bacterium]|nr:ribbon-helix-helix protein, CopG family [Acidobacteriota bacterium]